MPTTNPMIIVAPHSGSHMMCFAWSHWPTLRQNVEHADAHHADRENVLVVDRFFGQPLHQVFGVRHRAPVLAATRSGAGSNLVLVGVPTGNVVKLGYFLLLLGRYTYARGAGATISK